MSAKISKAQTFGNVIFNALTRGATLTCQLVATTVVARNFSASDMGVVGFANVIIGFLLQFSDCGLGSAVIRRPNLTRNNLETAFTLKVILGLVAFSAAWLIAPFARHFFDHPATGDIIRVLALNFLISSIGFLPLTQMTREMNFKSLVIPGVVNATVRATLAVTLVLCGWKYWAVVLADVCANCASGIAMQCVRRIKPGFRFNRDEMSEYLRFGLPLLGMGVLVFTILYLANFLIGAHLGKVQLGYYTVAFTWGSFICGLLSDTVNSVLFPTFAAIQNDAAKMRRWYLKTVDLVAFLSVVANTTLLANAHSFLVIFLGKGSEKWLPAAIALQILCVYGVIRAITEPIGSCLMARGQTSTLLRACVLVCAVQLPSLGVALWSGKIEWVAVAVLLGYSVQGFVYFPVLRKDFSISLRDLIWHLWPILPAMLAGWWATHAVFSNTGGSFWTLICRAAFTASVTALVHSVCSGFRCVREAWELISHKIGGKFFTAKLSQSI